MPWPWRTKPAHGLCSKKTLAFLGGRPGPRLGGPVLAGTAARAAALRVLVRVLPGVTGAAACCCCCCCSSDAGRMKSRSAVKPLLLVGQEKFGHATILLS